MKKWMWIAIAIVVLLIVMSVVRQQQARQQALNNQLMFNQANTTGTGLLAQIGNLFSGSGSGSGSGANYTETEAKEISKQIADLIETENEENITTANSLMADLEAKGWKYVGYNMVTQLV